MAIEIDRIRRDFKTLGQNVNGKPLVYLDNAATTHKPKSVIDAIGDYYRLSNGNPHRGVHDLGVKSTMLYENARDAIGKFINAKSSGEIIFTKNATESLNLVAYSYGMNYIGEGEEIVLCISEHHSNIVPWQMVAKAKKATLKYLYLGDDYRLKADEIHSKITEKTRLVSIAKMSNVLGTVYPIDEIVDCAHKMGAVVVVDGAQSLPHYREDVQESDADFFVFSGHKMFGPMGIGVLYGKEELLNKMPPFLSGGDMIEYVEEQDTSFSDLPNKFEAGTPNVAGALGLATAIEYLDKIGFGEIEEYEEQLTDYALTRLSGVPYIEIYGPADMVDRGPVISFSIEGCHPHDIASIVDLDGIAIRAGHHCAQPLMNYLGAPATSRASLCFYNTKEEIDILIQSLKGLRKWFGYGS